MEIRPNFGGGSPGFIRGGVSFFLQGGVPDFPKQGRLYPSAPPGARLCMVYHMSRLVQSPWRSSISKLKKILFY